MKGTFRIQRLVLFFVVAGVVSCQKKENPLPFPIEGTGSTELSAFYIPAGQGNLMEDFPCPITDGEVNVFCPLIDDISSLVVCFDGDFAEVTVNGVPQRSGKSSQNFNNPVVYTVSDYEGNTKDITVRIKGANGIPRLDVFTENQAPVLSKTDYVPCTVRLSNDPVHGLMEAPGKIRGRGNATWFGDYPKKPYKIKFDEKQALFGFDGNRDWAVLAEYTDRTLLRVAYLRELEKRVGVPYPLEYRHVDFYLNSEYLGTYIVSETVERAKSRVNIGEDGFIFECDWYYSDEPLWFTTNTKHYNFTFQYPEASDGKIVRGDANYEFIRRKMNDFEAALYGSNFKDENLGYRKFIDMESFAKWYVVHELLRIQDPNLYFTLPSRDGKLQMAPDWDPEWSLGNAILAQNGENNYWEGRGHTPAPDAPYWDRGGNCRYYSRMIQDPAFVNAVRAEWAKLKPQLPDFQQEMRDIAQTLIYTQEDNFTRWKVLGKYESVILVAFDTWSQEVLYAEDFLAKRITWFDSYLSSL